MSFWLFYCSPTLLENYLAGQNSILICAKRSNLGMRAILMILPCMEKKLAGATHFYQRDRPKF